MYNRRMYRENDTDWGTASENGFYDRPMRKTYYQGTSNNEKNQGIPTKNLSSGPDRWKLGLLSLYARWDSIVRRKY